MHLLRDAIPETGWFTRLAANGLGAAHEQAVAYGVKRERRSAALIERSLQPCIQPAKRRDS
jgi:hypothetical protein